MKSQGRVRRRASGFRPRLEQLECRITPSVNADFNGDGFGDLAIGVPRANSEVFGGGAVHVVYGSAGGLSADAVLDAQVWTQEDLGFESEHADQFGATLAAGDFNGDGFGDLAIGVPNKDVLEVVDCGAVMMLFGSPAGLHAEARQILTQGALTGSLADNRPFDLFGYSLAAGDFNGDKCDDLAIGAPNADTNVENAGLVYVVPGSAAGLDVTGSQRWHQGRIGDDEEAGDAFGATLCVGNFNGDAYDDLAVAATSEKVGTVPLAGAVDILLGGPAGLQVTGAQIWTQNSTGIADTAEGGDRFGGSLAAGDINHDGKDDLAIGVPGETLGTIYRAGAVNVLYSGPSGLTFAGNQFWTQNSYGIADQAEASDQFGTAVALADLSGDGRADLVVGVPHESFGVKTNAGAVHVIFAATTGRLNAAWNQFWTQGAHGLAGTSAINHKFGAALAIGDFNGDGRPDLVIGAPGDLGLLGAVYVLYGSNKRLTSSNTQYWTQEDLGIFPTLGELFGFALAGGSPLGRSA
jgi:FG-GAP repeat